MSFQQCKQLIEPGDTVILYLSFNNMHAVAVEKFIKNKKGNLVENVFQTTYGALKIMDLVGVPYGHQVRLSRGWAIVLQPTPELWTLTLPHRTQILYTPDISLVLLELDLRPGSVVCEAGTGSGSLSHAIIRTVAPSGHLYTCDFHEQRSLAAADEFAAHGLSASVTATHRDVCGDGFGLDHVADAVFLDLPRPWDAIPFAVKAIKTSGGRLCSFSPCIEQTQKTSASLRRLGFTEVQTVECLQREFQVRRAGMALLDIGQQVDDMKVGTETSSTKGRISGFSNSCTILTGVPLTRMPGHTGFLTFATLPPSTSVHQ